MLVKMLNHEGKVRWIDPEAVRIVFEQDDDNDHGFEESPPKGMTIIVMEEGVDVLWTRESVNSVVAKVNHQLR